MVRKVFILSYTMKKIFFLAGLLCVVLFISSISLSLRAPFLFGAKFPLIIIDTVTNEVKALVFFHRNFYDNLQLRREFDTLKSRLSQANEAYLENARLKELLALKQNSPYRLVAAKVIGASVDNWSSAIIIDKGRAQGIKRSSAVITALGLVGRVVDVQVSISKVLLINDPDFGVSAIVQRSRQQGLVTGTLGRLLAIKYLPADADIKIDDTVITSGLTEAYPKGLNIGNVVEVHNEFSGLSRYALIKPAVNLSSLEEVLVIVF
ncbi:MAG: rod shape-determining protein MreC [Candidatus Omnitrophica bacterium]|nr:rod shape-determining protein MreC [Candidatus Omnitrophota bacterium]